MQFLPAVFFLLLSIYHTSGLVEAFDFQSIQRDLTEYNITCELESCGRHYEDSLSARNCHCGVQCVQLGTCCLYSYYALVRQPKLKPTCRETLHGSHTYYYMVDQCPSADSIWASPCNNEWEGDGDLHKIVPVTSLSTNITYKNYYCFRCHETTDEFLYWNIKLESKYADNSENRDEDVSIVYNKINDTWMASYDKSNNSETFTYFPVKLTLQLPYEIRNLAHDCYPNIISDCSDEWKDEKVREKCQSYMGIKVVQRKGSYKNIHCALCNFENLADVECRYIFHKDYGKVPFSFSYLLDINRSDGELVGKIQKCTDDHLWDPYTKQCKKLSCALPGYKIKSGKCTRE